MIPPKPFLNNKLEVAALALAWLGIWGTWVWHSAISLSQGALDLAEWSTFLPAVRFEGLTYAPELLRFGVALECVVLAFAAGRIRSRTLRWGLRLAALLPGGFMLPPYPDILSLWWSASYGLRFTAASLALIGVVVSPAYDLLSRQSRDIALMALCFAGIAVTVWGLGLLLPLFAPLYANPIRLGWGVLLFLAGLLSAAVITGIGLYRASRQSGPAG